jgi:hypothetical protein
MQIRKEEFENVNSQTGMQSKHIIFHSFVKVHERQGRSISGYMKIGWPFDSLKICAMAGLILDYEFGN